MEQAIELIWRCFVAGGMSMAGAWMTVEWVFGPFVAIPSKWKRLVAFFLGSAGVFAIQEAHWICLAGTGYEHNYWSVLATALFSGGLVPRFHGIIKSKLNVLTIPGKGETDA